MSDIATSFDYSSINEVLYDATVISLVARLYKTNERLTAFCGAHSTSLITKSKIESLAVEQSADAACKMAGIRIPSTKLHALVSSKTKPKNYGENNVIGYIKAMSLAAKTVKSIGAPVSVESLSAINAAIDPSTSGAIGDANSTKNECYIKLEDGKPFEVVKPLPHDYSAEALTALCDSIAKTELTFGGAKDSVEPLILASVAVVDFIYIHPFLSGNIRTAMLLATTLFQRYGFNACRYMSLEKHIEDTRDGFIGALTQSYSAIGDAPGDLKTRAAAYSPIIKYLLNTLLTTYVEYGKTLERLDNKAHKNAVDGAIEAILSFSGPFTKADLERKMLTYGKSSIGNALHYLVSTGYITKHGSGKSTCYIKS